MHRLIYFLICLTALSPLAKADVITLLGRSYNVVEMGKDESLFGLSQQFSWDYDSLIYLNPDLSPTPQKGMLAAFPNPVAAKGDKKNDSTLMASPAVSHKVEKGESVYSIASVYGISVDDLYAYNPEARKGVHRGMVINIPSSSASPVYTVEQGETLYDVARKFNSRVADIMRMNPGIRDNNFLPGTKVRVPVGSDSVSRKVITVTEKEVTAFHNHKVEKKDTWTAIARNNGIEVQTLLEANPSKLKLKKGEYILVPVISDVARDMVTLEEDPREASPAGRNEIYAEVRNEEHALAADENPQEAAIAIIIEGSDVKRDQEFLRGFLLAVDEMKLTDFPLEIRVIDAAREKMVAGEGKLKDVDMVFVTFEKDFPDDLARALDSRAIPVVNVFNVRNDLYRALPNLVQFLTPSEYFNDAVAEYVKDNYSDYFMLTVGRPSNPDTFSATLLDALDNRTLDLSMEEFKDYYFSGSQPYFIYAFPTERNEVVAICDKIQEAKKENPAAEVVLFGRPNWIVFAENNKEKMGAASAQFPSRMYFNDQSADGKAFTTSFSEVYDRKPQRMYPVPAAMGYDVAEYFLPILIDYDGDLNESNTSYSPLQLPVHLSRASNWSGLFNDSSYILKVLDSTLLPVKIQ